MILEKNEHTENSRRTFIKNMTYGIGGASLGLSNLSCANPVQEENNNKLGMALVGLGYYSTGLLAPALQTTEHCYLAGVVTGSAEKGKRWQQQYGLKSENIYNYDNFDSINKNDDIDVVYIVLPNAMHKEYVIRAARAGKHVICEKPMAMSAQECEAMIEACEKANVKLSIGYRMQFEPTTNKIMQLGQAKVYGNMHIISAAAGYRETRANHWKTGSELGGGAMRDMGVYALQAARYVTGEEPITVTAQSFIDRPSVFSDVDETTSFQLKFPGGAVANLFASHRTPVNYLHATAEKGWFKLDPFSTYSGIKGMSVDGPLEFPQGNQQAAQMDDTCLSIIQNKPLRVSGLEGLKDIRVVDAIYEAARTGKKINLSQG